MKAARILLIVLVLLSSVGFAGGAASSPPEAPIDVLGLTAAADASGRTWAVWAADDGRDSELFYSRWDGDSWTSARAVHASPDTWESGPSLAIAPDGTAWLAWTSASREDSDVYLSRWLGSRWSEPQVLDRGGALAADEPALAAAPDGTFWLAWVGEATPGNDEVYATSWDGRAWAPSQHVSGPDLRDGLYDRQPCLAVGPDGRPWLAWAGHQDGPDDEIYASHWTGSAWTAEQMVSRDDDALDAAPSLVVDGQGRPWLAWKARVAEGNVSRLRILVSSWDAGQGWSEEALASSPLEADLDEYDPLLSLDAEGRPELAWLAIADGTSALALATRQGAAWSEPQLLREPVAAAALAVTATAGGAGTLLWADPALDASLPVEALSLVGGGSPLLDWVPQTPEAPDQVINVDPITNRWLAFGDSITWSQYPVDDPVQPPFYPYPSILQDTLNARVMTADVVNVGEPGEQARNGKDRIKDEVSTYTPQYVLIMEGTNDISHDRTPAEVYDYYLIMLDNARKHAGVDHIKVMMATIIPRLDSRNDETAEMNQDAVLPAAAAKNVPVCDQWTAFYNYVDSHGIPLGDIYWDEKHPNQEGLEFFAATWYNCQLSAYSWLTEETAPPSVWVDPLPPESVPGPIYVSWNGSDNLSWVVDYDVQVSLNGGAWTDWLLATTETNAYYTGAQAGDLVGFRARGRDVVGNESAWSAEVYTTLVDDVPPEAFMADLPAATFAPIDLSWWATDALSAIVAYRVEYRVGASGAWAAVPGLYPTVMTGASFTPSTPQYGQTYYFRASAQDAAGNWSLPSAEASTILAQYGLSGTVYTPSHEPVAAASVSLDPAALLVANQGGGSFLAYLAGGGSYDVTVSRPDRYGALPAMYGVTVDGNVGGLSFVLPPPDDAVVDGGFEAGDLAAWDLGGSTPPALVPTAHTGLGAVHLGGAGETASLGQVLTPPAGDSPTLSFLVRLDPSASPGVLQIELANTGVLSPPLTYTLDVDSQDWVHVWYDLDGLVSEPLTLTFRVSDTDILLDEIGLGSSPQGIYPAYVPFIGRN